MNAERLNCGKFRVLGGGAFGAIIKMWAFSELDRLVVVYVVVLKFRRMLIGIESVVCSFVLKYVWIEYKLELW